MQNLERGAIIRGQKVMERAGNVAHPRLEFTPFPSWVKDARAVAMLFAGVVRGPSLYRP